MDNLLPLLYLTVLLTVVTLLLAYISIQANIPEKTGRRCFI